MMRKMAITIVMILCMTMLTQFTTGARDDPVTTTAPNVNEISGEENEISIKRIERSDNPFMRDQNGVLHNDLSPQTLSSLTRASDDEGSNGIGDFYNGSHIASTPETISGSLSLVTPYPSSDLKDWYKIDVPNVDPGVPGSIANFTITLNYFRTSSSSEDDLYELRLWDEFGTGELTLEYDYADLLKIEVLHVDEYNGITRKGGHDFFYDDGDDYDDWTHDSNWSFNWRADLPSEGTLDTNGGTNGLTELNWYYIGISHKQIIDSVPTVRDDLEMEYEFTISAPVYQSDNVYPNDLDNATSLNGEKSGTLSSLRDHEDWFEITGSYDKIWNISYFWNRSTNLRFENDRWYSISSNVYQTMWMHFHLVYSTWGPDRRWGTSDDGWESEKMVLTQWFDTEGWLTSDPSWSGYIINNMTGGNATQRKVYMGVILEAIDLKISSGSVQGFNPSTFGAVNDYSISVSITEVAPNNPPSISNISVLSTNPQHVSNGSLEDDYQLSFTYSDEDNDPPDKILLAIDDELGVSDADLQSSEFEVNTSDTDYTDGKDYVVTFTGTEIGVDPLSHTVRMIASDNLTGDQYRLSKWSDPVVLKYIFSVWDDTAPGLNPAFSGFHPVQEDSPTFSQPMDKAINGIFQDDEGFEIFQIWNASLGYWDTSLDTSLLDLDFTMIDGFWFANITPKQNQHGTEYLKFKGVDQHMAVEAEFPFTVNSVNDPPRALYVEVNGVRHIVDYSDHSWPSVFISAVEDEELSFRVHSEDGDLPEERLDIFYSYVQYPSDPWEGGIVVNDTTGNVTYTPTNDDIRQNNSRMVIRISDHFTDGDTYLVVNINITNVNDPPEIIIPTTTPSSYMQFTRISISLIMRDIDLYDVLTVTTNMMDMIREELPYARLQKEVDWDIDLETGDFWFQFDDQEIWRTDDGMVQQREIHLRFTITDLAGANDSAGITLILTNENEEPGTPGEIFYSITGMTVNFWVDPVFDPDEDRLTYKWEFGGGGPTGEGINVNHTYAIEGVFYVIVWVEDGMYMSDRVSRFIVVETTQSGLDSDQDGYIDDMDDFPFDPAEWKDTDLDGVGDNTDHFPLDPAASLDTDGDGHPDEWNDGYSRSDSTTGLSLDLFPEDERRWSIGDEGDSDPADKTFLILVVIIIIFILVLVVIVGVIVAVMSGNSKEDGPSEE